MLSDSHRFPCINMKYTCLNKKTLVFHTHPNNTWLLSCLKGKIDIYVMYREYRLKILLLQRTHGRDRMVVGFTTTYAISAYNH